MTRIVTRHYLLPLVGFRHEGARIELAADLDIDRVNPAEQAECHRWGAHISDSTYRVRLTTTYVDEEVQSERYVGSDGVPVVTAGKIHLDLGAYDTVRRVASALRVFKSGAFSASLIIHHVEGEEADGASFGLESAIPGGWVRGYRLEAAEGAEFARFWQRNRAAFKGDLGYALHRFDLACTRIDREDELVDLMIAAEALFLTEVSAELEYRMSLRIAFFLSAKPEERQDLMAKVKKAYDARSWVVHGKTRRVPRGVRAGKQSQDARLAPCASEFEEVMRRALQKALDYSRRQSWPPSWEEMILGAE